MLRPTSGPHRALSRRLKRLVARKAPASKLVSTTNPGPKAGQGKTPDRSVQSSPPVVNLSLNYPTGGRLRLYLDFDKNPRLTKHDLPVRAQHQYSWRQRDRARRACSNAERNQPQSDRGELCSDTQPGNSDPVQLPVSTSQLQETRLAAEEPTFLGSTAHETDVSSIRTEPSQGEEEAHETDTCVSRHEADSDAASTPSLSQESVDDSGQGGAQVNPCRKDTATAERCSVDTAATSASNSIADELSATFEHVSSSGAATEQSDIVPSFEDSTIHQTSADDHKSEAIVASKPELKTAEPASQPVPRFRPYKMGRTGGDIVSKLLQPLSVDSTRSGYVYIFRYIDVSGLVKIGYTAQTVARRLREWEEKCGQRPLLIHSTSSTIFYRCAEALIHQELADKRREETCPVCKKIHNEWFEVTEDQAIQVADRWVQILDQYELYDDNGRMSLTWYEVIRDLQEEGAVINSESLLRRYQQLIDSKASEVMEKMNGGESGFESAPSLTTALTDLPASEAPDITSVVDFSRSIHLEAPAAPSTATKHANRDPSPETTQVTAREATSTDQMATASLPVLASPETRLLLAGPSPLLRLPTPTTASQREARSEAFLANPSTPHVNDDTSANGDDQTAPRTSRKTESEDQQDSATRPAKPGILGLLFALAAIDAFLILPGSGGWW